jgi:hypothetical protein
MPDFVAINPEVCNHLIFAKRLQTQKVGGEYPANTTGILLVLAGRLPH